MDQSHEMRTIARRHKEALDGILKLIEEIVSELKLEPGKASYFRERLQKLQFLMR